MLSGKNCNKWLWPIIQSFQHKSWRQTVVKISTIGTRYSSIFPLPLKFEERKNELIRFHFWIPIAIQCDRPFRYYIYQWLLDLLKIKQIPTNFSMTYHPKLIWWEKKNIIFAAKFPYQIANERRKKLKTKQTKQKTHFQCSVFTANSYGNCNTERNN